MRAGAVLPRPVRIRDRFGAHRKRKNDSAVPDIAPHDVRFKSLPAPSGTPSPHSGGVGESIDRLFLNLRVGRWHPSAPMRSHPNAGVSLASGESMQPNPLTAHPIRKSRLRAE
jgi:hypothetical protein